MYLICITCGISTGLDAAAATRHYSVAREHLEAARRSYVLGLHEVHPKVAWALEGLGKIHEKCGHIDKALECFREATSVRRKLQAMDQSKEM